MNTFNMRVRAAHLFRRIPWFIAGLQRIYQRFRPKFTIGAVGLIFNERGEILLVEHILHPTHPWGPPGGWLESGETPAVSVAREVSEEVGLEVEVGDLLHMEFLPAIRHVTFAYFCTAASWDVKSLSPELIGFGWFALDSLPNVYPFTKEAIHIAQMRNLIRASAPQGQS